MYYQTRRPWLLLLVKRSLVSRLPALKGRLLIDDSCGKVWALIVVAADAVIGRILRGTWLSRLCPKVGSTEAAFSGRPKS